MSKTRIWVLLLFGIFAAPAFGQEAKPANSILLFNGKNLDGWTASTSHWKVEDGTTVAEIDDDASLSGYSYLVWNEGTVGDFELNLQFRITGDRLASGGILFRCSEAAGFYGGYQADIDRRGVYVGSLSDAMSSRGTLVTRGQSVTYNEKGERQHETFASLSELAKAFRKDDWNDFQVIAKGSNIALTVNGIKFGELHDHDRENFDAQGALVFQVKGGRNMKIEFRKAQLKTSDSGVASQP